MGDLRNDFWNWEFESPDVHRHEMRDPFLDMLQSARSRAEISFVINSGWRTPAHHAALYANITKDPPNSAHLEGWAADIHTGSSRRALVIVRSLILAGFKRIILYSNFVHVDCHPNESKFPRPMLLRGTK